MNYKATIALLVKEDGTEGITRNRESSAEGVGKFFVCVAFSPLRQKRLGFFNSVDRLIIRV